MDIELVPLDPRRHRLSVERADGSTDSVVLETRSYLLHDLSHLAVEIELGLTDGYFGSVAAGAPLQGEGVEASGASMSPGALAAEGLAARLQTSWKRRADLDEVHRVLASLAPGLVDRDATRRILERLRALTGHWAATRHGSAMKVTWPS